MAHTSPLTFLVTFPSEHSVEYYVPPGVEVFILEEACSSDLEVCEQYFIGKFKNNVVDSIQYGFHIGPCNQCYMSFLVEMPSKHLRCCSCGNDPTSSRYRDPTFVYGPLNRKKFIIASSSSPSPSLSSLSP